MRRHATHLVTVAMLGTGGALAQTPTSDLERCESLYATYERHLGKKSEGQQGPSLEIKAAIEQCRRGNTADGIRTIERTLRANGFRT